MGRCGARAQVVSSRDLRLRPYLAVPAADEGPRGIGDLHRWAGVEAAVDGAFLGSDGIRDVALTRRAALRNALRA